MEDEPDDAAELARRLTELDAIIADERSSTGDRVALARALRSRAWTLLELGRRDDALDTFRVLARDCAADTEPAIRAAVMAGAYERAQMLWQLDNYGECLEAIEDYLERSNDAEVPERAEHLTLAYRIRADSLVESGRPGEALIVCDAMSERFGDEDDAEIEEQLRQMQVIRVTALVANGRPNEARALCDELLDTRHLDPGRDLLSVDSLVSLRVRLINFDAPPEAIVSELESLLLRAQGDDVGAPLGPSALATAHALLWWRLQALQIDAAMLLSDALIAQLDQDQDPEVLTKLAETLQDDAHTLIFHSRFSRQRRNLLQAIAIRIVDSRERGGPAIELQGAGRLAATIALRRRLRNQTVKICEALAARLADEADPHLSQIRSEAMLTEAEAWASSLHLAQAISLWNASDGLGDSTWAAFKARAARSQLDGDLPALVICNTLMAALVGDYQVDRVREVAGELVERYGDDRAPSTRLAVAFARLLSR